MSVLLEQLVVDYAGVKVYAVWEGLKVGGYGGYFLLGGLIAVA